MEPHLFTISEQEAYDIDYNEQFEIAEQLFKNKLKNEK